MGRLNDLTPYFAYTIFVATLGPLAYGFHLAELNTPSKVITCEQKSLAGSASAPLGLPQCIPMTSIQLGLVSSVFTLGGLIGALAAGPLSAKQGRTRTMLLTASFFTLGPVFEALAPNIAIMWIGRLVSGLGAGGSIVTVPLYIAEISPPSQRGYFGAFTQIMANVGILVTQLLGYLLSYGQMWRVVLAGGGIIGFVYGLAVFTIPESPRWLADNGQFSRSQKILQEFRASRVNVEEEIDNLRHAETINESEDAGLLTSDHANSNERGASNPAHLGMLQVLNHADHRKAVIVVIVIMIAQQFTEILKSNSAILNLLVSALNIIVTILCAPLADKLGRKACLLASIIGMGTSSLALGFGIRYSISALSAVAVLFFVSSFAVGLGPVPFILASELVPAEAASSTQTWALCANWVSTFLVAQFFPVVNEKLGRGIAFFVFAGMAAFFAGFVRLSVPETKGKKDADQVWGRNGSRLD